MQRDLTPQQIFENNKVIMVVPCNGLNGILRLSASYEINPDPQCRNNCSIVAITAHSNPNCSEATDSHTLLMDEEIIGNLNIVFQYFKAVGAELETAGNKSLPITFEDFCKKKQKKAA